MFRVKPDGQTVQFHIVLVDGFSLYDLSVVSDILQLANVVQRNYQFDGHLVGPAASPAKCSLGTNIAVQCTVTDELRAANIVVLAGADSPRGSLVGLLKWLRTQASRGLPIIGIGGGTGILLKAGLATDRKVAVHWQDYQRWDSLYPNVEFTSEIFSIDGQLISCAGGDATIDMMLHGIASLIGQAGSFRLAGMINLGWLRRPEDTQAGGKGVIRKARSLTLRRSLEIIHQNYREGLSLPDIAGRCKVTPRQLQRLFRTHLGLTPSRYLANWRLERARLLLSRTAISISDAALSVGFSSVSNFSRQYASAFGLPPYQDRKTILRTAKQGG